MVQKIFTPPVRTYTPKISNSGLGYIEPSVESTHLKTLQEFNVVFTKQNDNRAAK